MLAHATQSNPPWAVGRGTSRTVAWEALPVGGQGWRHSTPPPCRIQTSPWNAPERERGEGGPLACPRPAASSWLNVVRGRASYPHPVLFPQLLDGRLVLAQR